MDWTKFIATIAEQLGEDIEVVEPVVGQAIIALTPILVSLISTVLPHAPAAQQK